MRIALFCVMAERTKYIHAQRSFRFLPDRHKTLANGTLAKRLVGETTNNIATVLFRTTLTWEIMSPPAYEMTPGFKAFTVL